MTMNLLGSVISGRGTAKTDVARNHQCLREITGRELYHGSLNLILKRPVLLDDSAGYWWDENKRLLWPAQMNGQSVWLYRWRHAPLHVVEVLAEVRLRDHMKLRNNSCVEIAIPDDFVLPIPVVSRICWWGFWWLREDWSYQRDGYDGWAKPYCQRLGATQEGLKVSALYALRRELRIAIKGR